MLIMAHQGIFPVFELLPNDLIGCQERHNLAPDGMVMAVVQRIVSGIRFDP